MGTTLIFGHKNPDTDSICSALAYADLKTKSGADVEAVCPYCSTLYKHNPKLAPAESVPALAAWHEQAA